MTKKEEKRKKIIDTSLKLFIKSGFHGTPTSLIAKEAGIATGTLFNYFKTKDILINEIFKSIKIEQVTNILNGITSEKSKKKQLKKVWNNMIIWGLENPEKRKFLEYFDNSYYITEDTLKTLERHYKKILMLFNEIGKRKKMNKEESLMALFNFVGACIYTEKYFEATETKYSNELSNQAFERFCIGLNLIDED